MRAIEKMMTQARLKPGWRTSVRVIAMATKLVDSLHNADAAHELGRWCCRAHRPGSRMQMEPHLECAREATEAALDAAPAARLLSLAALSFWLGLGRRGTAAADGELPLLLLRLHLSGTNNG